MSSGSLALTLLCLLCAPALPAQQRQVALTFDDLPRGGDSGAQPDAGSILDVNRDLLAALRGVPATGFVNAGGTTARALGDDGLAGILKLWQSAGKELGNHSYSHPDLNRVPVEEYTADILRGEPAIRSVTGRQSEFFRHPFLHAGKTLETRRRVEDFLAAHGYRIAPVTLDNSDWLFAAVYAAALRKDPSLAARVRAEYVSYMESIFAFFEARSVEVTGGEIPQVLLLHVNRLNADAMSDLLLMMKRRGYSVIPLSDALKDDAYRLPDTYAGTGGFSWIHRWSKTKGMPPRGEPEPADWINAEFKRGR